MIVKVELVQSKLSITSFIHMSGSSNTKIQNNFLTKFMIFLKSSTKVFMNQIFCRGTVDKS